MPRLIKNRLNRMTSSRYEEGLKMYLA